MPTRSAQPTASCPAAEAPRPSLRDKALAVHARLGAAFGRPAADGHGLDPLSALVYALLAQRMRNRDPHRPFEALRARFPDWAEVIDAPLSEIGAAITGVTWPVLTASRIRDVLRAIRERRGTLDLGFLAAMEVEAALAWLERIPGIGPKTSAAVLAYSSLRMPALPVDSHHHRVAQRLGLIGPRVTVGPAHAVLRTQLPADWSAQDLCANHAILALHGQQVCQKRRPACGRCVLVDLCPSASVSMREP